MSYLFCSQHWIPCGPHGGLNERWWTWHSMTRWTEVERCHHKMSRGGFPHPQICHYRFWCSRKHSWHGTPAQSGERWGGQKNPLPPQLARSSQCCMDTGLESLDWRYCQLEPRGFLHIWHLIVTKYYKLKPISLISEIQSKDYWIFLSYLFDCFLATWSNF